MSTVVLAGLAAGAAAGGLVAVAGLTGRQVFGDQDEATRWPRQAGLPWRVVVAGAAGGLLTLLVTGWFAGGALVALGTWAAPRILGGKAARDAAIARTEAIAAWTEMVRDSISAASGLEEAIAATGPVAPVAIAPEVHALTRRLDHQNLAEALDAFGTDVSHPSADLVVAALVIATRAEASDLTGLLSRLAEAIRDDARMRIRVEVGRSRVRTAAKIITGVVAATLVLLSVANRDYLGAYDSGSGQGVLVVVAGVFALGGWLLERMARIELPDRFTGRST